MPTVSVKLAAETKVRLERIAAEEGITPHAVMVGAIESELERRERHSEFVQAALKSREETLASGMAYDGREYIAYAKAKLRGEKAAKPKLKPISQLVKGAK